MKLSVYLLKTQFQALLLPVQQCLIRWSITPNQVTLASCLLCVSYAVLLVISVYAAYSLVISLLLLLFPVLMFVRMAMNALDGMLAKATQQTSATGAVLNEVCDVVCDAALLSVFLVLLPTPTWLWWLLTLLCLLTEFISLSVYTVLQHRSHNGPLGKSDRAVYLGLLALLLYSGLSAPWLLVYIIIGIVLAVMTLWNRYSVLMDNGD